MHVLDNGFHVYVWVGKGSDAKERASGMPYAEKYLAQHGRPPVLPITRVAEGRENGAFNACFNDQPIPGCACAVQ